MIIAISGRAGCGKSTVGRLLAKRLGYDHYSMGDFQREIAEEKGISIIELGKIEEEDPSIDEEVDQRQIMLGRNQDNFVIDSRLGYHFIPHSLKIFLDADLEVRAKRVLNDKIRKEHNIDLEVCRNNILERESSELKRYKTYYDQDPYDVSQFDLVIDVNNKKPDEIVKEIIRFIESKNK